MHVLYVTLWRIYLSHNVNLIYLGHFKFFYNTNYDNVYLLKLWSFPAILAILW